MEGRKGNTKDYCIQKALFYINPCINNRYSIKDARKMHKN
jgi:hypothetical protein